MNIEIAAASIPDPIVLAGQAVQLQRAALVLRKQQDVEQGQAAALLELVRQPVPEGTGRLIDVRV